MNLTHKQTQIFKQLSLYNPKHYIYPGVLIRNLNIEMKTAYEILDCLKEEDYLEERIEIYCPDESKSTGILYSNLLDMLAEGPLISCPECGQEINIQQNNILIYKVIKKVEFSNVE